MFKDNEEKAFLKIAEGYLENEEDFNLYGIKWWKYKIIKF